MKLRILAAAAALIAVVVALSMSGTAPVSASSPCGAPASGNAPQDHCYTVTLSSYNNGDHPNASIVLNLGTDFAANAPYSTAFFDEATTDYQGICPGSVSGTTCTPATGTLGAQTGTVSFDIQSNVLLALAATNNVDTSAGAGQPPECGAAGTQHLTPAAFTIYAAVTSASALGQFPSITPPNQPLTQPLGPGIVSTVADSLAAHKPYAYSQEPDFANGGVPMEVNRVPDWYGPLLTGLGIPQSLIKARSYGIAQAVPGVAQTSVDFLTIDATGGVFANVTVLGNPIPVFDNTSAGQATTTCPPFGSTVNTLGQSAAVAWGCTGGGTILATGTYDSTRFNVTNGDGTCGGTTAGPGGVNLLTINSGVCTTCNYEIALSSANNLDSDVSAAPLTPAGYQLFNGQDNCILVSNGTQADANNNGIGDACKGGNANAMTTCALGAATASPPWAACQDADADGALNSVDNCPLTANPTQTDALRDGLGDACRPVAGAIGDGNGYAPGTLPGITSVGQDRDFDDICNAPFTIGGGGGTPSCLALAAGTYAIFAPPLAVPGNGAVTTFTTGGALDAIDSNDNAIPDFIDTGAGNPCLGDHKADTNGDGYSDFDEATPRTTTAACTGAKKPTGPVTADPIHACAGRNVSGTPTQIAAAKKARADVDLDGKVTILDLSAAAGAFGQSILGATDRKQEFNQDADAKVTILDLSAMASVFLQTVPAC